MNAFQKLTPRLQHQIVHDLGWRSLRPIQERAIDVLTLGANALILAPTAGGKTEAALLPLLSMLDEGGWHPASILYVAPLRALLNNQAHRLERLAGLLDRSAFKWHGDVSDAAKRKIFRQPADILATTPESLEAMLMREDRWGLELLSHLRAVVIDEAHALAGSERGGQLMAILERIKILCEHDLQRIGLSATVGNTEELLAWLSGSSQRAQQIVRVAPKPNASPPDLTLDYVGSLENAGLVISQLHKGEKRLVFVESRRHAEALGADLRNRGLNAHVIHGSLSAKERHQTERVFETERESVIVSTSAMELGIDIGDLDRVIQIDAPTSVASMLQRMGRSGRREGQRANYTILATTDEGLWRGAALFELHASGYVEPVRLARRSYPLMAQQLMALALQGPGVESANWWTWLDGAAPFLEISQTDRDVLFEHMLDMQIVTHLGGRLCLGAEGESRWGRRHFMDLCAQFATPQEVEVVFQGQTLGSIDSRFALRHTTAEPLVFILGGQYWCVLNVNWREHRCEVEPVESSLDAEPPVWLGGGVFWNRALCEAMQKVVMGEAVSEAWSRRAKARLEKIRQHHVSALQGGRYHTEANQKTYWTFAGGRANQLLAEMVSVKIGRRVRASNLALHYKTLPEDGVDVCSRALRELDWENDLSLTISSMLKRRWVQKFLDALPESLLREWIIHEWFNVEDAQSICKLVYCGGESRE